jgi:preprotein translocase subunit SecF
MAAQNQQKFFEIIKPHSTYEFIGNQRYWIGTSIVLVFITVIMLPLNVYVFKSRGHMLNWGVDFRGGTEMLLEFSHPVDAGLLRRTLGEIGHENADVVRYEDPTGKTKDDYLVRLGAVSVLSTEQAKQAQASLAKEGEASLKKFEWSEGGDKIYLRYDKPVDVETLSTSLKAVGIASQQVQPFGRLEENTYEVTLVSLDKEIWRHLDEKLGAGTVTAIPQVESVGAKAGKQLQFDGVRSLLAAMDAFSGNIVFRKAFARVSKNAGIFYIAQYERDIRRDFASDARVSDGHKVRAFARTQHADTEFALINHALYLQAGYVKPQALGNRSGEVY